MRALKGKDVGTMNWAKCFNGSIIPSSVKGAVYDFVASLGLPRVTVRTTKDKWPSFYFLKP